MSKIFTASDVASHNKSDSLYIIVDGDVYDLTKFQDDHPGGKKILQRVAGKDASKQFWKYHNDGILKKYKTKLQVGSLDTKPKEEPKPAPAPAPAAKPKPVPAAGQETHSEPTEALEPFGDQVPFSDPSWYQNVRSNPGSHRRGKPSVFENHLLTVLLFHVYSITLLTSMRHTLLCEPRSESGLKPISSLT